MPKIYSVVEIRSKSWALVTGALVFFISLSMALGVLLPIERAKRKEAEEARERLTTHAHRLAQAKVQLQKQLRDEKERKEAIVALLRQTQNDMALLKNQLAVQTDHLKIIQAASAKDSRQNIELFTKQKPGSVSLGKVVVGQEAR
ncbi:MAG: hypothetical protein HYS56_03900 [Candidatus Omnitrophica bacterium]|nr:hypothetical protein [Candidatus Omnitrophota bacterium]